MSYDIVIIHGVKDSEILPYTISSIKKFVSGYNKIFIISQDPGIELFKQPLFKDCTVISENDNEFFTIKDVSKIINTSSRNGWYLQQLLKLYAAFIIPNLLDDYVVIDSDTIFLKPIYFKQGERYIFNTGTEHHVAYFQHMTRLHHSLKRVVPSLSGVTHHMIFNRQIIMALFSLVSEDNPVNFWKVFLEKVDPSQYPHSGASEYEIYFNFMLLYYKANVFLRTIKFENVGIDPDFAIEKYKNSEFYYISIHSWMRPQTVNNIHFGAPKLSITKSNIVSGENIQELCDVTIITREIENFHRSLPKVNKIDLDNLELDTIEITCKKYKSFFIYTHILDLFVERILPFINHEITIVTHNSDHPINDHYICLLNSSKVKCMISQNIEIDHPKLIALPIGIANNQWVHGNKDIISQVASFSHNMAFNNRKSNVYVNFTIGTFQNHRNFVYNQLKKHSFVTFAACKDMGSYFNDLLTHKWVACPRGNGVDTHRFWEALYAGCIPLVDGSICSKSFKNLPVIYVDDWTTISLEWIEQETNKIIQNIKSLDYSSLQLNYWKTLIPTAKKEGDFILCYIGNLPSYTEDCIKQIRLWNPTYLDLNDTLKPNIYVCTSNTTPNKKSLAHLISEYNIVPVFIEDLTPTQSHILFNTTYNNMSMDGFWKYATERFFIVEQCMRKYNLENIIHLEIDNLIYFNLKEKLNIFKSYNSILVPSDNESRFIAGICFINNPIALSGLNYFFAEHSQNRAEMEIMMLYSKLNKNCIKTLPTIMPEYKPSLQPQEGIPIQDPARFSNLIKDFNCIFDAAAIGQYMFGIDPIHNKNNTDGFVNPHCAFRIDKCKLKWKKVNGLSRLNIGFQSNSDDDLNPTDWSDDQKIKWYPIYNLHIHNKSLYRGLSNQDMKAHLINIE